MEKDFYPYFVVYRYKGNLYDHSLYMSSFLTLGQMYAFIGNNVERWDEYHVARTLESYNIGSCIVNVLLESGNFVVGINVEILFVLIRIVLSICYLKSFDVYGNKSI